MDANALRADLISNFGDVEDEVLDKCIKLCQMYNLSGERLFYISEEMRLNERGKGVITAKDVGALQDHVRQKVEKEKSDIAKKQRQQNAKNNRALWGKNLTGLMKSGGNSDVFFFGGKQVKKEPGDGFTSGNEPRASTSSPTKVRFQGPNMDETSRRTRAYRYMYEKPSERSEALDDQIDEMAELVKAHYGITDLGDPASTTEAEIVVVGRITLDGDTSTSGSVKLNEASLALESSRYMGSGVRVPLRFDPNVTVRRDKRGPGGAGFFPGAIVALRGKNGGGGWFSVAEILSLPPLPPLNTSNPNGPFRMCIACGPFSPENDLKYSHWFSLLAKIKSEKPDVLLLVGPFLDSNNTCIKQGDLDISPSKIFRDVFVEPALDYLNLHPDALVLLVPNVRDILSDRAVFPQGELSDQLVCDPRVRLLPNPCLFSLNGLSIAVSSVDILFHLRKEEFFKRAPEVDENSTEDTSSHSASDPMANLCRHLLEQRSFYPIFPVPGDVMHEVNLDVTHAAGLRLYDNSNAPTCPDVLVVPSRLKQFVKTVDHTTAVNPSFLTKGTFSIVTYGDGTSGTKGSVTAEIAKLDGQL